MRRMLATLASLFLLSASALAQQAVFIRDPNVGKPLGLAATPLMIQFGGYGIGQTPVTASSSNVANAVAIATLPAVAGMTNYISGFQCTASGATAAAVVTATVAGVITGTMNYTFAAPAGVAVGANPLIVKFDPPIPASAVNTAIVVTLPALGAGNTNATCAAQGWYQ